MSLNLNQLRIFSEISRAGNITRAAERLDLSQPAVSKQLVELEQSVGMALFDRLPRGVRLTPAGELLLNHATRILSAEHAAEQELAELAGLSRGRLSVGASTTIGSYLVPRLFGEFHREHPEIGLELEIANTAVIQDAVLDNRVDLGLTEGFVSSDALDVEVVHRDEMVAIAAPGDAWVTRPVAVAALARKPFILREQGSGTRAVVEAALAQVGVEVEPVMSLGSTEAVKSAVAAGLGIAFVSRLTVELELAAGRLVALDVADLQIRRALHLVRLKSKRTFPAVDAFVRLLRRTFSAAPTSSQRVRRSKS
jgi:DNA-binding transcriptional LysR family regulator